VLIRTTGDTIALTPPLIIDEQQIDQIVATIGQALRSID
jgi:beta-alanine--pyruvate transaminase